MRKLSEEQLIILREGHLVYDPRDPTQATEDQSTWKRSHNPALLQARIALAAGGDVDWSAVVRQADICDEPVELKPPRPFSLGNAVITMDAGGTIIGIYLPGKQKAPGTGWRRCQSVGQSGGRYPDR